MRCYLLRGGHICAVRVLNGTSDDAVIGQAKALFERRGKEFHGFEVWDRNRFVHRHPSLPPKYTIAPDTPIAAAPVPRPEPEIAAAEKAE